MHISLDATYYNAVKGGTSLSYVPMYRQERLWVGSSWIHKNICRDQSRYVPSQWEMSLDCNDVSHWLGTYLGWSLHRYAPIQWELSLHCNDVSHWLGTYLVWSLHRYAPSQWETSLHCNDVSHWLGTYIPRLIPASDDDPSGKCLDVCWSLDYHQSSMLVYDIWFSYTHS